MQLVNDWKIATLSSLIGYLTHFPFTWYSFYYYYIKPRFRGVDYWSQQQTEQVNAKVEFLEYISLQGGEANGSEDLSSDKVLSSFIRSNPDIYQGFFKKKMERARNIHELVRFRVDTKQEFNSYLIEPYTVKTRDGYSISIHKLTNIKVQQRLNTRKPVFIQHGMLICDEGLLLTEDTRHNVPFVLADKGYDVWLGNARGNAYGLVHETLSVSDEEFWNFSLDELCEEMESMLSFVLDYNKARYINDKLIIMAASQGFAQVVGCLSLYPHLNDEISVIVGLSPLTIPQQPLPGFLQEHPENLYKIFGRRSFAPFLRITKNLMSEKYFVKQSDNGIKQVFHWKISNISESQKLIGYPKLFSGLSVKNLVHWIKIMNQQQFSMFDGTPIPLQKVTCKMVLYYGGADNMVHIENERGKFGCHPNDIEICQIPDYEHLDLMWGEDVDTKLNSLIYEKLKCL